MKAYTYTAKDGAGAIKRGVLQAADRGAALAALKAKGLTPVSVTEGGQAPREAALPAWCSARALALVGLAVVLGAGCWLWLRGGRKPEKPVVEAKGPAAPAERQAVAPVQAPVKVDEPTETMPQAVPAVPAAAETPVRPVVQEQPSPPAVTAAKPKAMRVLKPGYRGNTDTNAPNPYATFRTRTERVLSQLLSARPGEVIVDIGLGPNFEKDFQEALKNQIEIYPTDSEEMAAHKEDVAWSKEELKKMVAEGASPQEVIAKFREEHNAVVAFRTDLQRKLTELKKEGKLKEAEEFVNEANELLKPYKTRPLSVHFTLPVRKQE